jgi:hypothetical protein
VSLLAIILAACGGSTPTATQPAPRRAVNVSPQPTASPVAESLKITRPGAPAPGGATGASAPSLRLPSDGQQIVVVDSTEGQGVWVRRQPAGDPLQVWPDGAPMLVIGEDRFADGRTWRNVATLDGETGWVAADFLVTADPAVLAAALSSVPESSGRSATAAPSGAPGLQARTAGSQTTAAAAQAAPPAVKPAAGVGQPATQAAVAAGPAAAGQPEPTPVPTATPIRAPAGAKSIDAGSTTLALAGSEHGLPIKIGNRPRDGMELVAVNVSVTNRDDVPFALYRGSFRLALSDRSRVEPLAGGTAPIPYSAEVSPGEQFQGSLTFEVPVGTRIDSLVWAPERDVAYALSVQ